MAGNRGHFSSSKTAVFNTGIAFSATLAILLFYENLPPAIADLPAKAFMKE